MKFTFPLWLCFSLCFAYGAERKTICLNMIVKNESHIIKRALDSVRGWIDYWLIVDTGSTDGTQASIKEHMKGIPGILEERPWKNFAHNRNEALELARNCGDYILFLDADDWFECDPNSRLPDLVEDAYGVTWQFKEIGFSYTKPQLIKAAAPWRWRGVLHEYLSCDRPFSEGYLPQIRYCCGREGARSQDPDRFLKDVEILKEALIEEPENSRYVFYLAESLRFAHKNEEALHCYAKRVEMRGWSEEVFWSLLQIGHLKHALNFPIDEVIQCYYRAHWFRPHRPEPIYYIAYISNKSGKHEVAYSCLKRYQCIPQPETRDILFNLDWIRDYGLGFEQTLAAFSLGRFEEFASLCQHLLQVDNLPENFKSSIEHNLSLLQ